MSRSWAKGSTTRWRRIRASILARDAYTCQLRIPDVCTQRATHVHHVTGRATTGDDPAHLMATCAPCNLHVGDPTARRHDPTPTPRSSW